MDRFFMLYVEGRNVPKVIHEAQPDAVREAERLARLPENRGRMVYVLETVKVCYVGPSPVTWSKL